MYLRRAQREISEKLISEWDKQGQWRARRRHHVLIWGGAVLGVFLLLTGDTVERIFGIGFIAIPAFLLGITAWVYWKALRILRRERRSERIT